MWKQVQRLGRTNVNLKWIPSHQSANANETWEQKVDRRGNEIADIWAEEGRKETLTLKSAIGSATEPAFPKLNIPLEIKDGLAHRHARERCVW